MKLYRKWLIVIVGLLFLFLFLRLFFKPLRTSFVEGLDMPEAVTEATTKLALLTKPKLQSIANINNSNTTVLTNKLPINQYCIKASYNSAVSGDYVSEEMLSNVIGQGCRFIDFEVLYDATKDAAFVSYTTDPSYITIKTKNRVIVDTLFQRIAKDAFSKPPNSQDPLFLQLRIKSNDSHVYKAIAKSVRFAFKHLLYSGTVDETTTMHDVMGSIVLIIDKTPNLEWKAASACDPKEENCYDLSTMHHLESGSNAIIIERYNALMKQSTRPPHIMSNNKSTDVSVLRIVEPDNDLLASYPVVNPDVTPYILNYGSQIVTYNYNNPDAGLTNYEKVFNTSGFAIVPLFSMLQQLRQ